MKILVVSDTHGDISRLQNLLDTVSGSIGALIHAGDYEGDAAQIASLYPNLPVFGARGNCDYAGIMPLVRIVELCGKRIFITHGHRYDVNYSLMKLAYTALENGADICIYGHTHIPHLERYRDMYILNPGSLSRPRGGSGESYAVIDIDKSGNIDIKQVEYK